MSKYIGDAVAYLRAVVDEKKRKAQRAQQHALKDKGFSSAGIISPSGFWYVSMKDLHAREATESLDDLCGLFRTSERCPIRSVSSSSCAPIRSTRD